MKKFIKKCTDLLIKYGIIEPLFSNRYPSIRKDYVEAVTRLAHNKVNRRFLIGPSRPSFLRYKIHPRKGMSLFFRWLRQAPKHNA